MIRRRVRRRDVAPVIMAALKFVGPMLASEIVRGIGSAVTSSAKEQILDPALAATREKAISTLEDLSYSGNQNTPRTERLFNNAERELTRLQYLLKKEGIPVANRLGSLITGIKHEHLAMLRKRDSAYSFTDSRLKRSINRPGRATSWEIRATLGNPNIKYDLTKYIGKVMPNGDVAVWLKGSLPGSEPFKIEKANKLDQMALLGDNYTSNPLDQWIGPTKNMEQQVVIENNNKDKLSSAREKIMQILRITSAAINAVGTVSQGLSNTVKSANAMGSNLKNAYNSLQSASAA